MENVSHSLKLWNKSFCVFAFLVRSAPGGRKWPCRYGGALTGVRSPPVGGPGSLSTMRGALLSRATATGARAGAFRMSRSPAGTPSLLPRSPRQFPTLCAAPPPATCLASTTLSPTVDADGCKLQIPTWEIRGTRHARGARRPLFRVPACGVRLS